MLYHDWALVTAQPVTAAPLNHVAQGRGGKKVKKASEAHLHSDDNGEGAQWHRPGLSADYIRNSTNVNHAQIGAVLQRPHISVEEYWDSVQTREYILLKGAA